MMAIFIIVWLLCGIPMPLLMAAGAIECKEKERLLQEMPDTVTQPSDCLMECTALTFYIKRQLQDKRNIRLKDSREGALGEYCWPMDIKCLTGESLQNAFVVLPVDTAQAGSWRLNVRSTLPTAGSLSAHNEPTTLDESCGLAYEVTRHFNMEPMGASFCVQVTAQHNLPADHILRCPPFLATFWQRGPNQSTPGG